MPVTVLCTTLLIEKSPQALPLGAACIASAIKHNPSTAKICEVSLNTFCFEDSDFPKDRAKAVIYIEEKLLKKIKNNNEAIICFSCFVWNVEILEAVSKKLRKKGIVCIAGGPEITAHPDFYKGFDYTVSGEGEISVPSIVEKIIKQKTSNSDSIII